MGDVLILKVLKDFFRCFFYHTKKDTQQKKQHRQIYYLFSKTKGKVL